MKKDYSQKEFYEGDYVVYTGNSFPKSVYTKIISLNETEEALELVLEEIDTNEIFTSLGHIRPIFTKPTYLKAIGFIEVNPSNYRMGKFDILLNNGIYSFDFHKKIDCFNLNKLFEILDDEGVTYNLIDVLNSIDPNS